MVGIFDFVFVARARFTFFFESLEEEKFAFSLFSSFES